MSLFTCTPLPLSPFLSLILDTTFPPLPQWRQFWMTPNLGVQTKKIMFHISK